MNRFHTVSFRVHDNCKELLNSNVSAEEYPDNISWYRNYEKSVVLSGFKNRIYGLEDLSEKLPIMVLPCTVNLEKTGMFRHITVSSMTNYYTPVFAPLSNGSCDFRTVNCLIANIIKKERPTKLVFSPLGESSEVCKHISASLKNLNWITTTLPGFANWYLPVNFTFGEYASNRSAKLRNTYKRKRNKFAATPGSAILIVNGENQLEKYIADYLEVYRNSWKEPEPHPEFIPGLMRLCASRGELRLGFAYLHSKPVAVHFWIVSGGVAHIYKLSYDQGYKQLSAGTLVMWEMMKHVIDTEKVTKIDFLTGDDVYKADWMSDRQERVALVAFNAFSVGGMFGVLKVIWFPKLIKLARRIRVTRLVPPQ